MYRALLEDGDARDSEVGVEEMWGCGQDDDLNPSDRGIVYSNAKTLFMLTIPKMLSVISPLRPLDVPDAAA